MSFSLMSPAVCSSVRNMGRPTTDGYWCSGKFYKSTLFSGMSLCSDAAVATHLASISDLEETGASIEDCIVSSVCLISCVGF